MNMTIWNCPTFYTYREDLYGKEAKDFTANSPEMKYVSNYDKSAFINILGLALGMACCILIYLFVRDEFSYDSFHENVHRIFRVLTVSYNPDGSERVSGSYHPVRALVIALVTVSTQAIRAALANPVEALKYE